MMMNGKNPWLGTEEGGKVHMEGRERERTRIKRLNNWSVERERKFELFEFFEK
jgi:hypothetical protein